MLLLASSWRWHSGQHSCGGTFLKLPPGSLQLPEFLLIYKFGFLAFNPQNSQYRHKTPFIEGSQNWSLMFTAKDLKLVALAIQRKSLPTFDILSTIS